MKHENMKHEDRIFFVKKTVKLTPVALRCDTPMNRSHAMWWDRTG